MLILLRSTVTYFFILTSTMLSAVVVFTIGLFGSPTSIGIDKVLRNWSRFVLWVGGIELEVRNEKFITGLKGGALIAINHLSLYDIPIMIYAMPCQVRFMAKKSLFNIPIFGMAMRKAGIVEIDRSHGDKAIEAMNNSVFLLDKGICFIVFPEGTRSPDNEVKEFKKGPFVMAINAKVPIIPVVITGSYEVLPKVRTLIIPGKVIVHIQKPVDTTNMDLENRDNLKNDVRETIVRIHKKNRGELNHD